MLQGEEFTKYDSQAFMRTAAVRAEAYNYRENRLKEFGERLDFGGNGGFHSYSERTTILHSFILLDRLFLESVDGFQSCIVFASLYGKTSYPRNGNLPHIFYHFWGGSGGQTSTHCTQTPEMVICLVFFTDSGVCVQFLRKRKFMYVHL